MPRSMLRSLALPLWQNHDPQVAQCLFDALIQLLTLVFRRQGGIPYSSSWCGFLYPVDRCVLLRRVLGNVVGSLGPQKEVWNPWERMRRLLVSACLRRPVLEAP